MKQYKAVARSLHDLGLAIWAGGALMGAVGLNGATASAKDPTERLRLSSLGWARWAPVDTAAIAAHGAGSIGLLVANRKRLAGQNGVRGSALTKTLITVAAAAVTAYGGILGGRVDAESHQGGRGLTEPAGHASPALVAAQRNLRLAQWATPMLTGALIVVTAQQGQQRPAEQPVQGLRR